MNAIKNERQTGRKNEKIKVTRKETKRQDGAQEKKKY